MKKAIAQIAHLQIAQADTQAEFAKELHSHRSVGNIYSNFNNYIRNRFFPIEDTGETIIFAVDNVVINDFIVEQALTFDKFRSNLQNELRFSWRAKTVNIEDCFGLCALQIYIAHQMQDGAFTSHEYNPPLAHFLNINTESLQHLYSESQHKLWQNLHSYCIDNNFIINIPSRTTGPGCYIKYPLSQALMNQEDLKQSPILFERVGIKRTEYFPFKEFSKLIQNADNGCCMNSHYYKVKERLNNDFGSYKILHHQIFNFFINKWDGSYIEHYDTSKIRRQKSIEKNSTIVLLDKGCQNITIFDNNYSQIEQANINDNDLFHYIKTNHKLYESDFLIFEKDRLSDESEYVRKFELGNQYVLICKKHGKASNFISSLSGYSRHPNPNYDIYIVECLDKVSKHHFWSKFFLSQSRNYRIEGGLKLGYNVWMYGAGPIVFLNANSEAWLNGTKIENTESDCTNLPIGSYKLKIDSFPPDKFEIKDISYTPQTTCFGWEINKRENYWKGNSENFQISGLRQHFTNNKSKTSARMWIKSMTEMKDNSSTANQVINSIRRSNYGL